MPSYPSVTQVLGKYQDFSQIPPERLEAACERGTAVHAFCAAHAKGLWAPMPLGAEGYCQSFTKWFDKYVKKVIFVEKELICPTYGFIGHPDICCIIKGDKDLSLGDLKTPIALQPVWKAQLASYKHLTKVWINGAGVKIKRVFSLRLRVNGSMPIFNEYSDSARDFQAFINALTAHKYFS